MNRLLMWMFLFIFVPCTYTPTLSVTLSISDSFFFSFHSPFRSSWLLHSCSVCPARIPVLCRKLSIVFLPAPPSMQHKSSSKQGERKPEADERHFLFPSRSILSYIKLLDSINLHYLIKFISNCIWLKWIYVFYVCMFYYFLFYLFGLLKPCIPALWNSIKYIVVPL